MNVIDKCKEYKWLIISSLILILSILLFIMSKQGHKASTQHELNPIDELLSIQEMDANEVEDIKAAVHDIPFVLVDVKGAVKNPGVYQLEGSSRVIDAINVAGGLRDEAITTNVNFAKQLVDEMLIYIPVEGEELADIPIMETLDSESQKININTASISELESLSGIGPQKAQEIIRYREEEGNFKSIEELTNVSGIGVKTFEKLKDDIVVD